MDHWLARNLSSLLFRELVTPSTRKRMAPDVRITRAMKRKQIRQGPSGHSPSHVCAKCDVTSDITWMSFHRIPPYPAELPHNPSKNRVLTHRSKRELRAESMVRIGKGSDDRQKNLRICDRHVFETFSRVLTVSYNGSLVSHKFEFTVVSGAGVKSSIVLYHHNQQRALVAIGIVKIN